MADKVFRLGNFIALIGLSLSFTDLLRADTQSIPLVRSAGNGAWSSASTWEGGKVPASGCRVQIRAGHSVTYDVRSDRPIRSIHVAGTLTFASDKDTRLDVGLIKVQPGEDASETGFECSAHPFAQAGGSRPALLVGTQDCPIDSAHTATIRLLYFDGTDKESFPAIVCCGGRMEF